VERSGRCRGPLFTAARPVMQSGRCGQRPLLTLSLTVGAAVRSEVGPLWIAALTSFIPVGVAVHSDPLVIRPISDRPSGRAAMWWRVGLPSSQFLCQIWRFINCFVSHAVLLLKRFSIKTSFLLEFDQVFCIHRVPSLEIPLRTPPILRELIPQFECYLIQA